MPKKIRLFKNNIFFPIGFHLLLINQTPFQDVLPSLLKTTVMMIGENYQP